MDKMITKSQQAKQIPFILKRLDSVKEFRLRSKAKSTRDYAHYPNRFKQITYSGTDAIIVPLTSSERREYIPFGLC